MIWIDEATPIRADNGFETYFRSTARRSLENIVVFGPPPSKNPSYSALGRLSLGHRKSNSVSDRAVGGYVGFFSNGTPFSRRWIGVIEIFWEAIFKRADIEPSAAPPSRGRAAILPPDCQVVSNDCFGFRLFDWRPNDYFLSNVRPQLVLSGVGSDFNLDSKNKQARM